MHAWSAGGTVVRRLVLIFISTAAVEAAPAEAADLLIRDASILDAAAGSVRRGSVVIEDGVIREVRGDLAEDVDAGRVIDALGRLLTPGLIDVHHHTSFVLGDSITAGGGEITRLTMHPDSIAAYRDRFAAAYMPHGVTTVRDLGSADEDLPMLLAWRERSQRHPDFYPAGGALVSHQEGRPPYQGHTVLADSADAVARIRAYHDAGLRHVKLYWRLREPELRAAFAEATRLGMNVTGHIDYHIVPFEHTLDMGLRSFEHAYTLGVAALTEAEYVAVWEGPITRIYGDRRRGLFFLAVMECFNALGPDNPRVEALVRRLGELSCTVVPTLHIFAQRLDLSSFTTPSRGSFDDMSGLTAVQRARAREGYTLLAELTADLHRSGVRLALGTDCVDPGEAALAEMLLLRDAGIPMEDVFRIATVNGAEAIGVAAEVGTIETGKRANLVLFETDPLRAPAALLGPKIVIKDGVVFEP